MRVPEIPGVQHSATRVARRTRNLERRGIPSSGGSAPTSYFTSTYQYPVAGSRGRLTFDTEVSNPLGLTTADDQTFDIPDTSDAGTSDVFVVRFGAYFEYITPLDADPFNVLLAANFQYPVTQAFPAGMTVVAGDFDVICVETAGVKVGAGELYCELFHDSPGTFTFGGPATRAEMIVTRIGLTS